MKSDIEKELSLNKIMYEVRFTGKFLKDSDSYIGVLNKKDLGIVLITDTKDEIDKGMKSIVALHCAMSSVENIEHALRYLNTTKQKIKPAVNMLVPVK